MVNVDNGGGYALGRAGNEKYLYLPLSFGMNLKLLWKIIKSIETLFKIGFIA